MTNPNVDECACAVTLYRRDRLDSVEFYPTQDYAYWRGLEWQDSSLHARERRTFKLGDHRPRVAER